MHVLFVVLFVALALSIPIGISLVFGALSTYMLGLTKIINPFFVYKSIVDGLQSYPLLAVPLFIFSGLIMARGGIAKKIFEFFALFMGRVPAGLPITSVITCLFYGALSGSGPATTAAVGSMVIPYLTNLGYNRNFSVALVTVSGSLGVIIPPSVPFIVYALAANVSVGQMFIAGVLPGFLIGLCLSVAAYIYCRIHGEDKEKLAETNARLRQIGFWSLLKDSSWALLTPVIILGGIYGGVFTPTEAATVSVVYALVVSLFIYRTMTFRDIPKILYDCTRSLAPLLIVIACATLFGRTLTLMNLPRTVSSLMSDAFSSPLVVIALINLVLLVAGMLVNVASAILILTPVLLPIANAVGMDHIHFGIMMVVNLSIGLVTPPVGADLFVGCGMFNIPVSTLVRYALPFLVAFLVALAIVAYVPWVSLVFIR